MGVCTSARVRGCTSIAPIAIALARARGETEVFVCGGAEIYAQTITLADRLYLTLVEAEVAADTFFPAWDARGWVEQEVSAHEADEKNQYPFTFKLLLRPADLPR